MAPEERLSTLKVSWAMGMDGEVGYFFQGREGSRVRDARARRRVRTSSSSFWPLSNLSPATELFPQMLHQRFQLAKKCCY